MLGVEGAEGATRQPRARAIPVANGLPEGVTWEQINWAALSVKTLAASYKQPPEEYLNAKGWAARWGVQKCQAYKRCQALEKAGAMKSMRWKNYTGNKSWEMYWKWVGPIPKEFIKRS
jgi:hypothetical protein